MININLTDPKKPVIPYKEEMLVSPYAKNPVAGGRIYGTDQVVPAKQPQADPMAAVKQFMPTFTPTTARGYQLYYQQMGRVMDMMNNENNNNTVARGQDMRYAQTGAQLNQQESQFQRSQTQNQNQFLQTLGVNRERNQLTADRNRVNDERLERSYQVQVDRNDMTREENMRKAREDRIKSVSDPVMMQGIQPAAYDHLDETEKNFARQQYIETGAWPEYKHTPGFFGGSWERVKSTSENMQDTSPSEETNVTPTGAPQQRQQQYPDGTRATSNGRPIIMRNGQWEYE